MFRVEHFTLVFTVPIITRSEKSQNHLEKNNLLNKYGSQANFLQPHHYETVLTKNTKGIVIVKKGLEVPSDYTVSYYDSGLKAQQAITNFAEGITNYTYEEELQNEKRNIFVLKSKYIGLILDDLR